MKSQQPGEKVDLGPQTNSKDSVQPWPCLKREKEVRDSTRQEVGFCILSTACRRACSSDVTLSTGLLRGLLEVESQLFFN